MRDIKVEVSVLRLDLKRQGRAESRIIKLTEVYPELKVISLGFCHALKSQSHNRFYFLVSILSISAILRRYYRLILYQIPHNLI